MTRKQTRQNRAWYNFLSRYYDVCIDPFQAHLRRRGIDFLDASPGDDVLDVGCGNGRGVAGFQTAVGLDGHVVGIDVAEKMCRLTRDRFDNGPQSAVVCGDGLALPFDSDTFDAVLVSFTLELFGDDHRTTMLEEIRRVLKPQGRICVISPSKAASTIVSPLYTRLNELLPRLVDSRPVDVSAVLTESGFEIVRAQIESVLVVPVEVVVARCGSCA